MSVWGLVFRGLLDRSLPPFLPPLSIYFYTIYIFISILFRFNWRREKWDTSRPSIEPDGLLVSHLSLFSILLVLLLYLTSLSSLFSRAFLRRSPATISLACGRKLLVYELLVCQALRYYLAFLRRSPATISLLYIYLHSKEGALKHALWCIASVCALTQ
jgi:hypothetical protein